MIPAPSELEVMASLLLGRDDVRRSLPPAPPDGVRGALERAVLPALRRSPCFVSFSGGRDSSAVLAVAVDAARRHGLPEPVPVTMRFANAPETDERAWQQLVLDHLRLDNLEVIELDEQLDALGPIATDVVSRVGVRWPANAYMHVPILEVARGGSLLTGAGGDELLGTTAGRRTQLLRRAARPRRADARVVAAGLLPGSLRATLWRRRHLDEYAWPWLTPAARRSVARAMAREEMSWPDRWDRSVAHWYRSRAFSSVSASLGVIAEPFAATVVNPLVEPEVLAALMREGGPAGWSDRSAAMRRLFGDLLPEALITRPTKAKFSTPLWGPRVAEFARGWDGAGLDPRSIDVARLRAEWASPEPDFRTALLLHKAWLATR